MIIAGQRALDCFHVVISRLLQSNASEGCGVAVAPLAMMFILRYAHEYYEWRDGVHVLMFVLGCWASVMMFMCCRTDVVMFM